MKKIFIAGRYDMFMVGHIQFSKKAEDYLLVQYKYEKDFRNRALTLLNSISYERDTDWIGGVRSMYTLIGKTKPDIIAITPELFTEELVTFCSDQQLPLVVTSTMLYEGKIAATSMSLIEKLREFTQKELV